MSRIENYLRGLTLGTRLKQLRWQEEDRRREQEKEQRILATISEYPELRKAHSLVESGLPWKTALELSGYVSPEEKEKGQKKEMTGELAQIKSFYKSPKILQEILTRPETPPETKGRMLGLKKVFPGMITGYKEPQLTEEEASKALRIGKGLRARATAPPSVKKPSKDAYMKDPRFKEIYEEKKAEEKLKLSKEKKIFSTEDMARVWTESISAYRDLLDAIETTGTGFEEFWK